MPERPDDFNDQAEPSPLGAAATLPASPQARPSAPSGGERKRRFPLRTAAVLLLVAVVLLALVPAFATGLKKTPRNRVGISYGGGPIEGAHFQKLVPSGRGLFFNGFFDPLYLYPADQRSYIVSRNPEEGSTKGADSIVAPTQDGVQISYEVAVYFKLNTNRLRAFHEQLGLRYKAFESDGWNNLITDSFRPQVENALQEGSRRYTVADLYGNEEVLRELQEDVQATVSLQLESALGQQYFCGPNFRSPGECSDVTFVIKKIDLPESTVTKFEEQRNAEIAVETERLNTERRAEEARAIDQLRASGLTGADYVLLQAVEAGKINFWVVGEGSGVVVPPTGGATPSTPTPPGGG